MTMKLTTYAEVFGPDHFMYQQYVAGFKKTPGHLLRDVLKETNGRYQVEMSCPNGSCKMCDARSPKLRKHAKSRTPD